MTSKRSHSLDLVALICSGWMERFVWLSTFQFTSIGYLIDSRPRCSSPLGPMKMSPSRAPAITRTCFGLPTLQRERDQESIGRRSCYSYYQLWVMLLPSIHKCPKQENLMKRREIVLTDDKDMAYNNQSTALCASCTSCLAGVRCSMWVLDQSGWRKLFCVTLILKSVSCVPKMWICQLQFVFFNKTFKKKFILNTKPMRTFMNGNKR